MKDFTDLLHQANIPTENGKIKTGARITKEQLLSIIIALEPKIRDLEKLLAERQQELFAMLDSMDRPAKEQILSEIPSLLSAYNEAKNAADTCRMIREGLISH